MVERPDDRRWRDKRRPVRASDRCGFVLVALASVASLTALRDMAPPSLGWLETLPNTVGLTMFVGHPIRRTQGFAAPLFPAASAKQPCNAPTFRLGMADLKTRVGDAMGNPVECEHPIDAEGDTVQLTTTGRANYQQRTQTLAFTDGTHEWTLDGDALSVSDVSGGAPAPY